MKHSIAQYAEKFAGRRPLITRSDNSSPRPTGSQFEGAAVDVIFAGMVPDAYMAQGYNQYVGHVPADGGHVEGFDARVTLTGVINDRPGEKHGVHYHTNVKVGRYELVGPEAKEAAAFAKKVKEAYWQKVINSKNDFFASLDGLEAHMGVRGNITWYVSSQKILQIDPESGLVDKSGRSRLALLAVHDMENPFQVKIKKFYIPFASPNAMVSVRTDFEALCFGREYHKGKINQDLVAWLEGGSIEPVLSKVLEYLN